MAGLHQPLSYDFPHITRAPSWVPDWSLQTIAKRRADISRFEQQWRSGNVVALRGGAVGDRIVLEGLDVDGKRRVWWSFTIFATVEKQTACLSTVPTALGKLVKTTAPSFPQ